MFVERVSLEAGAYGGGLLWLIEMGFCDQRVRCDCLMVIERDKRG